jgi:hypothetical protein
MANTWMKVIQDSEATGGGLAVAAKLRVGTTDVSDAVPVPVKLLAWEYLSAEKIDADGLGTATLPTGASIVSLTAETAAVRYAVNGTADANSTPVPTDQTRTLGPLSNLESLTVFNAGSSVAFLEYYGES